MLKGTLEGISKILAQALEQKTITEKAPSEAYTITDMAVVKAYVGSAKDMLDGVIKSIADKPPIQLGGPAVPGEELSPEGQAAKDALT